MCLIIIFRSRLYHELPLEPKNPVRQWLRNKYTRLFRHYDRDPRQPSPAITTTRDAPEETPPADESAPCFGLHPGSTMPNRRGYFTNGGWPLSSGESLMVNSTAPPSTLPGNVLDKGKGRFTTGIWPELSSGEPTGAWPEPCSRDSLLANGNDGPFHIFADSPPEDVEQSSATLAV